MKRVTFLTGIACLLMASFLVSPLMEGVAQGWSNITIQFEENRNRGILAAQYRIVTQKKGCRLTIRLTNKGEKKIPHYWFTFKFKEGHLHENTITDHLPGKSQELTYSSCGVPSVHISEMENGN